jgi:hypothetical protein
MTPDTAIILDELRAIRDLLRRREKPPPIQVGATEAARMLAVSVKTLREWARAGKVPRFTEGGVHRYRVADLEAFSFAA